MQLRPYQQQAHAAAMASLRHSLQPIVIDAATGAGKSHIIAALAESLRTISNNKSVLCLAPSKELVIQNAGKYRLTGEPYSLYSASVGQKDLSYPVVFGSPLSVLNSIDDFKGRFCAVIIDEAAGLTNTVKNIVATLRTDNPHLRVVGLTATPYRLGDGYIYRQHNGHAFGEDLARDPWFDRCVYRIEAGELIEQGYLTPPEIGAVGDCYDTSKLKLNRMHKFDAADVEQAFVGKGRLTATIMGEVVEKSRDRHGVLIFASTVAHAEECLASLPPGISALVTGKTKQKERAELLRRFLAREIRYMVNVSVLSIGFDAPHVDVIAILRATESVGLFQQCIGRGLRLCEGKADCLILDYAENIDRHCPDGNVFNPEIKAAKAPGEMETINVGCPTCGTVNEFTRNREFERFKYDSEGWCLDLNGDRVMTDYGPLPAHHGRRCMHTDHQGERCEHRWTEKECRECGHKNDISARRCESCKAELADPNKKLLAKRKIDLTQKRTEEVTWMDAREFISKRGNPCVAVTFFTKDRSVRVYFNKGSNNSFVQGNYGKLLHATDNMHTKPKTITYRKNPKTKYFEILAYNKQETS